jgi:hypothetical protein
MTGDRRCTYCLSVKKASQFRGQGDHVVPISLGGAWIDRQVCGDCNTAANRVADELIAKDSLVRFLRNVYRIPDRRGQSPPAFAFSAPLSGGGAVRITVADGGPTFQAAMSSTMMQGLGLRDPADQIALAELAAEALGVDHGVVSDSLGLARAAQACAGTATPPMAWSRFIAKIALACGRDAFGDMWLESRHASILSHDLLDSGAPRFAQRTHYPPVECVWPYEPPKHRIWIEQHDEVALLMFALFGQVIAAVPLSSERPSQGAYSAWSFDPRAHSFYRSSFPAIWLGSAAARITRTGRDVVSVADPERPFIFIPDGDAEPIELPIPTMRADSPTHAYHLVMALGRSGSAGS